LDSCEPLFLPDFHCIFNGHQLRLKGLKSPRPAFLVTEPPAMRNWNHIHLRVDELEQRLAPATHSYSTNWAGYAVSGGAGSVSRVAGDWTVPAVSSNVSGYSSAWVGIDGWNSNSVEQIGTDSDYVNGSAQYYAWYEMYPAAPVNLTMAVHPGDHMSASVTFTGTNQFVLAIANVTTGGSFSTTQSGSFQRSSAEWIQEAPSSIFGVLPLSNFGTINFSAANATVGGTSGPADNTWSGTTLNQVDMVTQRGSLKATTSAITDSGSPATSAFSVTFVSSGSSGHGGGKKSPTLPPTGSSSLGAILAGTMTSPALNTVSAAATVAAHANPSAQLASFAATTAPVVPTFTTAPAPLPQIVNWEGPSLGSVTVSSMYPPSSPAPSTPAPELDAKPEAPANPPVETLDVAPVPEGLPADVIPLGRVRLASDLLDGADGLFNGNHDGQQFAIAALALTLAAERGWRRLSRHQTEKRLAARKPGEDPDDRRFQPKARTFDA
jgi:hypothetical protein